MTASPKLKPCKQCGDEFIPRSTTQRVCSVPCAIKDNADKRQAKQEKEYRAETRRRKRGLKKHSQHVKEAQAAVNRYVRMRDHGKPCASCNRLMAPSQAHRGHTMDAGHYRSRGAAGHLRFNLFNIHAQCVNCNRDKSGNVVDYRINLIRRIGLERVERLEHDNTPRTFTVEYLERVKRIFAKRARLYRKFRGIDER